MTNTADVVRFFTAQHGVYDRFIQLVAYEHGLRTFFERSPLLRSDPVCACWMPDAVRAL